MPSTSTLKRRTSSQRGLEVPSCSEVAPAAPRLAKGQLPTWILVDGFIGEPILVLRLLAKVAKKLARAGGRRPASDRSSGRLAAPPSDSIARAVAGDLEAQLGTANVFTAPGGSFDPSYRVAINVQRFESIKGQSSLVKAAWVVRRTADGLTRTGRTAARENVQDNSFEALAPAVRAEIAEVQ
jgi:hypothetical protein